MRNRFFATLLLCLLTGHAFAGRPDTEIASFKVTPEMRAAMSAPGPETPLAWLGNAIQYNYQHDPSSIEVGRMYRLPEARKRCVAGEQDSCSTAEAIEQWLAWARTAARQEAGTACDRTPCAHVPDELAPAALKGKVWVLHAWASWCPYCRIDHGQLVALNAAKKSKLVSLLYKDRESAAAEFLAAQGNPYGGGSIGSNRCLLDVLELRGVPATFLIGADGNIMKRFQGVLGGAGQEALEKYLK